MSNSSLISYTKLSPNHSGKRNHKIDTITIHCMGGNLSVESCGALFAQKSRGASSNYGIGSDGRIALYVDEKNRSWCSSSPANDHRAVTIEVANTSAAHPWPCSEKAYAALLDLVTDICRRNGIKQLLWKGDKKLIGQVGKQNMTVHRWFASKACPGDWLYSRHAQIAAEVNKRLNGSGNSGEKTKAETGSPSAPASPATFTPYMIRVRASVLNVRKGPSTTCPITTQIRKGGYFTIVGEENGWGKLKSGAGWIYLAYTERA